MFLNHDEAIEQILATYSSLKLSPPPSQWTVLASFFLKNTVTDVVKVISMATGTKCLPTSRYPMQGEALHDSHAEVLARRGAVRWFMEEVVRSARGVESQWLARREDEDGRRQKYALREDIKLILYVSTVPCGDASTRYLAASQDPEMAALKDSSRPATVDPPDVGSATRGRDNYSLYGVLRTKPGRADSPPTLCMSCSDKIAAWNVLGIQGALGSSFLEPLYLNEVVIGEVPEQMRGVVKEDCERALWGRLDVGDFGSRVESLPGKYALHKPLISFTSVPFIHSRATMVEAGVVVSGSCNDSLCWFADASGLAFEVLINGYRRGVSPKHRLRDKSLPLLCKLSMFKLFNRVESAIASHVAGMPVDNCERIASTAIYPPKDVVDTSPPNQTVFAIPSLLMPPLIVACPETSRDSESTTSGPTYFKTKQSSLEYQNIKNLLTGANAPFVGWVKSGEKWETFGAAPT
ncbi:hypothetical protein K435DRAFT_843797 [Dendrothele bispora CBS 962.96]|uniref:A to I editase domain-containing protein n=1 Tax=Dendrothele bispora (strain CBS 962.96) TaxID=1314807 RepID=A0A4S8L6A8_DENBC|nr:hypothetical protein K435DRAFT_843797 [Dendrothele bispora CBS 962.96]